MVPLCDGGGGGGGEGVSQVTDQFLTFVVKLDALAVLGGEGQLTLVQPPRDVGPLVAQRSGPRGADQEPGTRRGG